MTDARLGPGSTVGPGRPYRDRDSLVAEIQGFLRTHGARIADDNRRISVYFEILVFHHCVQYYAARGFTVVPRGVAPRGDGERTFRHKCGPEGSPDNFSYFRASRATGAADEVLEVRQNVRTAATYDDTVLYTPDVVVLREGSIRTVTRLDYRRGERALHFAGNGGLVTFVEAKHMAPFPELIATFVGLAYELCPEYLRTQVPSGDHLAPALAVSGAPNAPMEALGACPSIRR